MFGLFRFGISLEKEVEKNLTFAYDSVKIEEENKEVLECQFVTTS
ncbi:MAG: hypothetical protein DDT30_01919 [Dehalococcoidia bacterium]|nr:hypothetical protein [Candidatus Psychracetigena formicireducens]MBT9141330.1 hypothetical protein [Bacillota bacterium]